MPRSRAPRFSFVERADTIALSPAFSPSQPDRLGAERVALRLLLGADIAAAELGDDLRHRHVLVHHLDAGLGRLLGQRHDRRRRRDGPSWRCRPASTATASRSCCTIFSDVPAGEDVVDLRARDRAAACLAPL